MAPRRSTAVIADDGSGWLTRKLVDDLVDAIDKQHLPRRFAALFCGVSPQTFETALQEGANGAGGPLATELARRVYKAESKNIAQGMKDLDRLGRDDPRARHLYLQTRYPADFGGHVRTAADEFALPERQKRTRGMLLDNPPPRMLSEFRSHGWFRIPSTASPEDRAALLALLERCESAPVQPILTSGESTSEQEPATDTPAPPATNEAGPGTDGPHD